MHFSSVLTIVAASVASVIAASNPLQPTDKLISFTRTYFMHEVNQNARCYVTDEEALGRYMHQPDCENAVVVVDLREPKDYNDYQGHIKGAINLPAEGWFSGIKSRELAKTIEKGFLPEQLKNDRILKAEYVVFQAMDSTHQTVPPAAAYFNYIANKPEYQHQKVVIMRDEYKDFRRDSANKMLIEITPGADGHMNLGDKIKEKVKGWFGMGAQKAANKAMETTHS